MEDKEMQSFDQDNQDDFGLPEVKYEPLDREDEAPPEFEEPSYYEQPEEEEESKSKKALIIAGIIAFLIVAGLSIYLFLFGGVEQISGWFAEEPEPQAVTQVVAEPEPEPQPEPEPEPEPEPQVDPLAPYSEISAISEPTGRSYVVVGSFVDDDLAMDYSQQLLAQGIGSRILSPTNRAPLMHRVAVADYDNFQQAMNEITLFRNKYGDQTWVLKY
jgi:cell division protein FtsN